MGPPHSIVTTWRCERVVVVLRLIGSWVAVRENVPAAVCSLDNVDTFTREGLCVVWAGPGWNNLLIWIFVGKNDRIKSHTHVFFLFFSFSGIL